MKKTEDLGKKGLGAQAGEEKYDRAQEQNQEIGEEFLNPDKDMEASAVKIQRFYRSKTKQR